MSFPPLFTYLPPTSTGAIGDEGKSTAQEDLVAFLESLPSLRRLTMGISEDWEGDGSFYSEAREGAEDVALLLRLAEHIRFISNLLPVVARRQMDWNSWEKPMCISLLAAESGMYRSDECDVVSVAG